MPSVDNLNMGVLAIMSMAFGFAMYLISIAAFESPVLLGLSVPLIIVGAAILALRGAGRAARVSTGRRTVPLFVPIPLDDTPALDYIPDLDPEKVMILSADLEEILPSGASREEPELAPAQRG